MMRHLYPSLVLLLLILGTNKHLVAQASTDFENITTNLNCTNTDCQYTDPGDPSVEHELVDNNGIPVSQMPSGGTLGFTSTFTPSRTGSSVTGLTDGDSFGVAGPLSIDRNLGTTAQSGDQAFILEDTDGLVTLRFSEVDLTGANAASFSMFYFIQGLFEESDGANDVFRATLEVTNCAAATTLTLIDTDGGVGGSIEDLDIEDSWNELTADLSPYAGCRTQLVVQADFNSASEEMAIDNISFSQGNIVSGNDCDNDMEAPVVTCPNDTMVNTDAGFCDVSLANVFSPGVTDNCTEDLTATLSPNLNGGGVFLLATSVPYEITATATDAAGNSGSCTFFVTVTNINPPILGGGAQAMVTREHSTDSCTYVVMGTEIDVTSIGGCGPVTVTNDVNNQSSLAGEEFAVGVSTITWTLADTAGLTTTFVTELTVEDSDNSCISSLNEADLAQLNLSLFPNPTHNSATLEFQSGHIEAHRLEVRNLAGQLLRAYPLAPAADGLYRQSWDGTDASGTLVPAGLYLFQVHSDRGVFSRKLVLLR